MFAKGLPRNLGDPDRLGLLDVRQANGGTDEEAFTAIVLWPFGTESARNTVTLVPKEQRQYSVSALFPNVNSSSSALVIQGDADAKLFAYGSMVDNASCDPVFFAGQ
jgi:hypothetical protein